MGGGPEKSRGDRDDPKQVRFDSPFLQRGFTMAPNAVLFADLTPAAKLLYVALAHYAREDDNCFPGQERLAGMLGMGVATIRRATRDLEEAGWVRVRKRGMGKTNLYTLLTAQIERSDRSNRATEVEAVEEHSVLPPPTPSREGESSVSLPAKKDRTASAEIDAVWQHYAATMKPRAKQAGADERKLIADALKVATVAECQRAIDGCRSSEFHMGRNDRQRKYNRLSQILKGRRGKETTRERIDFFLDLLDEAARGGHVLTSADPAVMSERKRIVQRGWRFRDDPEAVRKAEEAEAWLRSNGVEVVRQADGYPTFRALRRDAE